jgi:hypothetical protein
MTARHFPVRRQYQRPILWALAATLWPLNVTVCHWCSPRTRDLHKSGVVFQVTPEPIDLCGGFVDRDSRVERDATARVTVCCIHSQNH